MRVMDRRDFSNEFGAIFKRLIKTLSKEGAWALILSWLQMRLDAESDWNELTLAVIEQLANRIDPNNLNWGIGLLETEFKDVNRYYWN